MYQAVPENRLQIIRSSST